MFVFFIPRFFPVCQLCHTVHHTDGHFFPAHRAYPVVFQGFEGIPVDTALSVAVVVVFSFLGEEFYSTEKFPTITGFHGIDKVVVTEPGIEQVCLPPQFFRRVSVRIGNKGVRVQETA